MARSVINDTTNSTIDGYNMAISGTTGIKTTGGAARAGGGTTEVNMDVIGYERPPTLDGRTFDTEISGLIAITGYSAGAVVKAVSASGIGPFSHLFRKGVEVSQGYGITPHGEVHNTSGFREQNILAAQLMTLRNGLFIDPNSIGLDITVRTTPGSSTGFVTDNAIANGRTNAQSYIYRLGPTYVKKTLATRTA